MAKAIYTILRPLPGIEVGTEFYYYSDEEVMCGLDGINIQPRDGILCTERTRNPENGDWICDYMFPGTARHSKDWFRLKQNLDKLYLAKDIELFEKQLEELRKKLDALRDEP